MITGVSESKDHSSSSGRIDARILATIFCISFESGTDDGGGIEGAARGISRTTGVACTEGISDDIGRFEVRSSRAGGRALGDTECLFFGAEDVRGGRDEIFGAGDDFGRFEGRAPALDSDAGGLGDRAGGVDDGRRGA